MFFDCRYIYHTLLDFFSWINEWNRPLPLFRSPSLFTPLPLAKSHGLKKTTILGEMTHRHGNTSPQITTETNTWAPWNVKISTMQHRYISLSRFFDTVQTKAYLFSQIPKWTNGAHLSIVTLGSSRIRRTVRPSAVAASEASQPYSPLRNRYSYV